MSYNYDRDYLARNVETVDMLLELYRTRGVNEFRVESATRAVTFSNFIRGILASMALNYRMYKDVKQTIRTWKRPQPDGTWLVYVGVPADKLRGSKPYEGDYRGAISREDTQVMLTKTQQPTWIAPTEITNVHEAMGLVQTIVTMKGKDRAEAISSLSIEAEPMKTLILAAENAGWKVTQEPHKLGQYKIIAERTGERKDQALIDMLKQYGN